MKKEDQKKEKGTEKRRRARGEKKNRIDRQRKGSLYQLQIFNLRESESF